MIRMDPKEVHTHSKTHSKCTHTLRMIWYTQLLTYICQYHLAFPICLRPSAGKSNNIHCIIFKRLCRNRNVPYTGHGQLTKRISSEKCGKSGAQEQQSQRWQPLHDPRSLWVLRSAACSGSLHPRTLTDYRRVCTFKSCSNRFDMVFRVVCEIHHLLACVDPS